MSAPQVPSVRPGPRPSRSRRPASLRSGGRRPTCAGPPRAPTWPPSTSAASRSGGARSSSRSRGSATRVCSSSTSRPVRGRPGAHSGGVSGSRPGVGGRGSPPTPSGELCAATRRHRPRGGAAGFPPVPSLSGAPFVQRSPFGSGASPRPEARGLRTVFLRVGSPPVCAGPRGPALGGPTTGSPRATPHAVLAALAPVPEPPPPRARPAAPLGCCVCCSCPSGHRVRPRGAPGACLLNCSVCLQLSRCPHPRGSPGGLARAWAQDGARGRSGLVGQHALASDRAPSPLGPGPGAVPPPWLGEGSPSSHFGAGVSCSPEFQRWVGVVSLDGAVGFYTSTPGCFQRTMGVSRAAAAHVVGAEWDLTLDSRGHQQGVSVLSLLLVPVTLPQPPGAWGHHSVGGPPPGPRGVLPGEGQGAWGRGRAGWEPQACPRSPPGPRSAAAAEAWPR